jgi:hypothetical protein
MSMTEGSPPCASPVATPRARWPGPLAPRLLRPRGGRILPRWGLLVSVSVLLVVFMAYLDPHLAVDLANRVWSCF